MDEVLADPPAPLLGLASEAAGMVSVDPPPLPPHPTTAASTTDAKPPNASLVQESLMVLIVLSFNSARMRR
jgi:hypothetical protein